MNPDIRIELLKLADGGRVLRLEHTASGLSLEKRLAPEALVVAQKEKWLRVFESLLARELAAA